MGHGKETPRQKMIGMMYLVLTALLALNVSKDVLNAFVLVDEGMMKTIENFDKKNESVYAEFAQQYAANQAKVGKYYDIVQEIRKKADELYEKMQELKVEIVKTSEGEKTEALHEEEGHVEIHGELIGGKDNADVPAQIMIGDDNNKAGKELRLQYEEFREYLISVVENEELKKALATSLNTDKKKAHGGEEVDWERANFEHLPLIGVLTLMTGLQTNVRNAEADVITYLLTQIDAGSFKFNKLEPIVTYNSNYILQGNKYIARVFLAAFDTTQKPIVYVGNYEKYMEEGATKYRMTGVYDSLPIDETGKAIFERPGSTVRNYKWGGLIKLKNSDGSYTVKPFEEEYQVAQSNVVVSPTKMNVFYVGVDNPVEISIPGVPGDKIFPQITNASISTKAPFIVVPKRPGNAILTVFAEIDGSKKKMGEKEFRVKMVPDPVAKVAGKKGGAIAKNMLLAQSGVEAAMENFDFDLQFRVTEFTVSAVIRGFVSSVPVKSNIFSQDQRDLVSKLDRGSKVYIEDIKAVGPDGVPRDLSTITFLIN